MAMMINNVNFNKSIWFCYYIIFSYYVILVEVLEVLQEPKPVLLLNMIIKYDRGDYILIQLIHQILYEWTSDPKLGIVNIRF